MSDRKLKVYHCTEVLDQELLIGADGKKRFLFHVLENEFRVYKDDEIIASGQAVEELLNIYNECEP